MPFTDIQRRTLLALRACPLTCTELGCELWLQPGQRLPGASQGGNRWTRNAGKVLKGLEKKRLVRWRNPYSRRTEWFLTRDGEIEADGIRREREQAGLRSLREFLDPARPQSY